jgi:hypothetical protein
MRCVLFIEPIDQAMLLLQVFYAKETTTFLIRSERHQTPEQILLDEALCKETTFQAAKSSGIPAAENISHLVM